MDWLQDPTPLLTGKKFRLPLAVLCQRDEGWLEKLGIQLDARLNKLERHMVQLAAASALFFFLLVVYSGHHGRFDGVGLVSSSVFIFAAGRWAYFWAGQRYLLEMHRRLRVLSPYEALELSEIERLCPDAAEQAHRREPRKLRRADLELARLLQRQWLKEAA